MTNETPKTPRRMKGNAVCCQEELRCEPLQPAAPPDRGKEAPARECPRCHCLASSHHGKGIGCEGAGGNCPCDLTAEQAAGGQNYVSVNRRPLCYCPIAAAEPALSPLTREEPPIIEIAAQQREGLSSAGLIADVKPLSPDPVAYLKAERPGMCILCVVPIYVGDLIHIGKYENTIVAAHHLCVNENLAESVKYGFNTGGVA